MAFGDIVQSKTGTTAEGGASTLVITLDSTPTEGNLLVAASSTRDLTQDTPSGWSIGHSEDSTVEDDNLTLYYKVAGAGESTSVTFNDNAASQVMLAAVYEIEGPWNATPLDKDNGAISGSSNSAITGTTGTLTQADEVAFAAAGCRWFDDERPAATYAVNDSFTLQHDPGTVLVGYASGDHPSGLQTATRVVSATTALNPTLSWGGDVATSNGEISAIATFKKSAGAGDLSVSVSEAVSVSDTPTVELPDALTQSVSEAITASESITALLISDVGVSEAIAVADGVKPMLFPLVSVSDTVSVAESVTTLLPDDLLVSESEAIGVAESVTSTLPDALLVSESEAVAVADSPTVTVEDLAGDLSISVAEAVGVAESVITRLEIGVYMSPENLDVWSQGVKIYS